MGKSILIGFYRRSGSTLLMNLMKTFDSIDVYGEVHSLPIMLKSLMRNDKPEKDICLKPMDFVYLLLKSDYKKYFKVFDKFVWITRMPMDTFLSEMETGYMYLSHMSKKEKNGIRTKFFDRWKKIYSHYFDNDDKWYLIRYEDITDNPLKEFKDLSNYLDIDFNKEKLDLSSLNVRWDGGDTKILKTNKIHKKSRYRYKNEMNDKQINLFDDYIGNEINKLGYRV